MHFIIEAVTKDGVQLKNGGFLPSGLVVWSTGIGPTEFVRNLPLEKNAIGQVV